LTQDRKDLFKACYGAECKGNLITLGIHTISQTRLHTLASVQRSSQENQFDTRLVIMRCKEFTYCLCNFIWPHRSRAFMFVRLRALFKSSVLIRIETQFFAKEQPHSTHER
ncbi:hypothetical protein H5410_057379, partial [Solanum commersonii]